MLTTATIPEYSACAAPHWVAVVLADRELVGAQPNCDTGIFLRPKIAAPSMTDCAGDIRKGVPVPTSRSANPRTAPSPNLLAGIATVHNQLVGDRHGC